MQHLMYVEPGRVEWQDAPDPGSLDPDAAAVRPLAVARCDIDLPMASGGFFPGPFPVGHEAVAEVAAVGEAVESHRVGDRVLIPFQVSCGTCDACREGRHPGCRVFRARIGAMFGFGETGGGFGGAVADLVVVPAADHMLVPAPRDIDPVVLATLPDNMADGYRTVAQPLRRYPGAEVLVIGGLAPSVGLYAVAAALSLGSSRVRYVDGDTERLEAADAMGAEADHHAGAWPDRFERALITVDNTGDPDGLAAVLRSTDAYGICTSVAIYFAPATPVPMLSMYTRGVTFQVSRPNSRRLLPEVCDLVASGRLDPLRVPTKVAPWDEAHTAWMEPATKLVVAR
jgi:threonine dehydrogenase-like Zn-dependent dehydrogenase